LGQQSGGFSDEDIADIICLLLPYSDSARQEVGRIAAETSQHMVGTEDVDGLNLDYSLEDESRNFADVQSDVGHIALRFSSDVKDPSKGFTFGRSPSCCDIYLKNDPHRRLSKIHFRIYLNEWGVNSGSKIKILMHEAGRDIVFLVRIPVRDGPCQEAYQQNLDDFLSGRARGVVDPNETIVPGPGGHVGCSPSPMHTGGYQILIRLSRWISSNLLRRGNLLAPLATQTMPPRLDERNWITVVRGMEAVRGSTAFQGHGPVRTTTIVCAKSAGVLSPRCIK
jgi:hypothetical protein